MDLKDIKAIIDLMRKNSISEFELEKDAFKIKLKRSGNGAGVSYEDNPQQIAYAQQPSQALLATAPAAAPAGNEAEIKSPMVGTFYSSPSPEASPYVEIGAEVGPDTVVCIIEAMKVMNEIKAEARGVITQLIVDNAKPVEFGTPLFKIRPI